MKIEKLEDKCSECMLCIQDCVSGVWRLVDGKTVPAHPDQCNRCSHCIAVCPKDAIRHDGLKKEQIKEVDKKSLQPETFRDIIMSRRSVRQFKNEPVPRAVIEQILDVARYAPTGSNTQNVGYIVVANKSLIEEAAQYIFGFTSRLFNITKRGLGRMMVNCTGNANNRYLKIMDYAQTQHAETGRDFILHNAPALLLIHGPQKTRFSCENCNIAAAAIINYAHTLGLGTCYVGLLTMALQYSGALRRKLGVHKGTRVYACLVLGYPTYRYKNTVSRKQPEVQWL